MNLRSKLPHVGTTIFTVMSNRARELGAINLAQGFPDYDPPEPLKDLVARYVAKGYNQYASMIGAPELREQIALKLAASYGSLPDAETEVTVTFGATEALFSAIQALVHPGDEVLIFDPSYDAYGPSVLLAGGRPIHLALEPPDFRIDWDRVRAAISDRTRMVILNTPHNPVATIASRADLDTLAELLRPTQAVVLADEVYEHMVYDGAQHASILAHPELRERGVAIFSFGKSLHATGWRVGYAVAPPAITHEIRSVHQFSTFSIATPMQYAIADFLRDYPEHCAGLSAFYQRKRDYFLECLSGSRLRGTPAAGTYFQLLDFSDISQQSDAEFAETLMRDAGVAAIPVSAFYATPPYAERPAPRLGVLRFCFAKSDSILEQAAERLRKL